MTEFNMTTKDVQDGSETMQATPQGAPNSTNHKGTLGSPKDGHGHSHDGQQGGCAGMVAGQGRGGHEEKKEELHKNGVAAPAPHHPHAAKQG